MWAHVFNSLPLLLTIFVFPQLLQSDQVDDDFSRQPPGQIIGTGHDRSHSDPQQVHISLAGSDHMRVTWITDDKHAPSIVEYGTEKGRYDDSARGEHTSYTYFLYSSGKIHHVKIGPLKPSTTYFYKCGSSGREFSFNTPPSTFPVAFAIVGDLGQTEQTKSTLSHVEHIGNYDVFLLPGDLSYAHGHQPRWDSFGHLVEPQASRRPWMVTEGNQEMEIEILPNKHFGFTAYNARWLMPYKESGSTSNLYYSFEVAGTHIVMLGSYTDFDVDSAQYKWLEDDLARVDRKKTPWIVVLMHVPWYNTNKAHQGEGEDMRQAMEELLYKARVDVVFAGHVHAYERFDRVYDNKADPCGPVYITIGDGGNHEGLAREWEPASPLSLYREASYGHGRLTIENETSGRWSWHRNDDPDKVVADKVDLVRKLEQV